MTKPLRQTMPTVSAWIDELRDAFGKEIIDASIRAGMAGQAVFSASEGGMTIGTPSPASDGVTLAQTVVGPMFKRKEPQC